MELKERVAYMEDEDEREGVDTDSQNAYNNSMDESLRALDKRVTVLEEGQKRLDDKIEQKFDLLCQKIDGLATSMNSIEKNLNLRMDYLEKSIDDKISNKVEKAKLQVIMWIVGTGLTVISLTVTIIKLWK
ncbi:MAG: hypothetical protein HQL03_02050 [Nitrospirae bacterium]|nr:hypothetical protein [Nitrospirota bacterium]MBF0592446.1 hypothetical protein [Nitrospirota bacterium]